MMTSVQTYQKFDNNKVYSSNGHFYARFYM